MADVEHSEPAAIYLFSLVLPVYVLFAMLEGGWLIPFGLVIALILFPLLDVLGGERTTPRPQRPYSAALESLLVVHILLQFAILGSLLWRASFEGSQLILWVAAVSCGFTAGICGIMPAHELGHHARGPRRWIGNLMMQVVAYPHFTDEHNRNHHRYVAMDRDGASAPRGRGFWVHLAMTIPLQWHSAYQEMARHSSRLGNPVLTRTLLTGLSAAALFSYDSTLGLVWLVYCFSAIFLLEYVNYIRHYGLHRTEGEVLQAHHSWDTEARWSRWTLLELTRHSAHHLKASTPFWRLQPTDGAPRLPVGYFGCFWPCMFPPLWRRMIHPHLDRFEIEHRGKAVSVSACTTEREANLAQSQP